jgi:hypothetical protein
MTTSSPSPTHTPEEPGSTQSGEDTGRYMADVKHVVIAST